MEVIGARSAEGECARGRGRGLGGCYEACVTDASGAARDRPLSAAAADLQRAPESAGLHQHGPACRADLAGPGWRSEDLTDGALDEHSHHAEEGDSSVFEARPIRWVLGVADFSATARAAARGAVAAQAALLRALPGACWLSFP